MTEITVDDFRAMTGQEPQQDDLHRVNCETPGRLGHFMCGICERHERPRFLCGCPHPGARAELDDVAPEHPSGWTAAALARMRELEPELLREFRGRPMQLDPSRLSPASVVTITDVEAWLRARGVIATLEFRDKTLVPVTARLVGEPLIGRSDLAREFHGVQRVPFELPDTQQKAIDAAMNCWASACGVTRSELDDWISAEVGTTKVDDVDSLTIHVTINPVLRESRRQDLLEGNEGPAWLRALGIKVP